MDTRDELRLLRLAVGRGLLSWEEVVAASGPGGAGSWLDALIASGRLPATALPSLQAELEREQPATLADAATTAAAGTAPSHSSPPPAATGRSALEPDLRFLAGWQRYRIEGFLGAGGMGSVYKAFDPTLNRLVAVKFLHRNDPAQTAQFLREARSQARVDHPNVCRVYEVGEVEGRPYIAMQYIDGQTLAEAHDVLPVDAKVRLVRDVARAVHAAHRTGLIHRDLKPGNVLVGRGENDELQPQVVDFGLARDADDVRLTRPGSVTGTPAYLSPEQALGKTLDRRTDVYSLGVMLYELLTGRTPFQGNNPPHTLLRLIQEEAVPLSKLNPAVPRDLETIVLKCLEKDPAKRYDSARALADDLERWLEGEPIAARPAGWAYRTGKRLRKHRAVAGVAAAAVVALLALGVAALRSHWRARETAELAQRFGQQVREVEDDMRMAALLPRHDISAHRTELSRQLQGIQGEMARLGRLADGPGNAALGRGFLALHQYRLAREHLEAAWRAGHRTPEVAASLGRAMGLLYERALVDASPTHNADLGETAREEIESTLGKPALSYLKEGSREGLPGRAGAAVGSPYLDALIAFYEGRFDEAMARARDAERLAPPWFYEPAQLTAEIYAARGNGADEAGRFDDALAQYDLARGAYLAVAARAPSDPALYSALCGVEMRRMEVEGEVGSIDHDHVAAALAACDLALTVDPELAEAFQHEARIHWRWAESLARRGEDPREELAAAVDLGRRAIALDPSATDHNQLAIAYRLLATWQIERGLDPGDALAKAAAAARTAVALQPELATSYNGLGNAYYEMARYRARGGLDPHEQVAEATAAYQEAIVRNPRFATALTNLGNAWKVAAEYRLAQGQDPSEPLASAVAALARAAELKPTSAPFQNNLGNVHLTLADYQRGRGDDPRQALQRAATAYRRAIAVNADYPLAYFNLGYTLRSLAEYLLARGDDVTAALAEADLSLDRAIALNPADADGYLERARVDLVAARGALARKEDPTAPLAAAGKALDRAAALNPRDPEVLLARASAERVRAEGALAAGRDPAPAVRCGLGWAAKAAAINPLGGRCQATTGALQQLAARGESDPARRRQAARRALEALEAAVAANPLLAREYGQALAEARALAGG
jgi:eukaryotic-like serine/threonine-protein kinase